MRQLVNPRTFGRPTLALALFGCKNRPFYQIVVFPDKRLGRYYEGNIIEQLGTYDPLPNYNNEKLASLNIGRIKYWIGERNARVTVPLLEILGLAGLLPIHPRTYINAREYRKSDAEKAQDAKTDEQKKDEQSEAAASSST
ncbi:28S ribosomal protein S16, mitochondrial [Aphelenchoides bicaudatus]|nr:28S ribosomal protein S16, mitochondrial [Aphelenchoides bicaudatus]